MALVGRVGLGRCFYFCKRFFPGLGGVVDSEACSLVRGVVGGVGVFDRQRGLVDLDDFFDLVQSRDVDDLSGLHGVLACPLGFVDVGSLVREVRVSPRLALRGDLACRQVVVLSARLRGLQRFSLDVGWRCSCCFGLLSGLGSDRPAEQGVPLAYRLD